MIDSVILLRDAVVLIETDSARFVDSGRDRLGHIVK